MPTVTSVMAELKKRGTEKTRKIYARHGMDTDNMFGVSVADLKIVAKTIKGQQALASELYATGNLDAMYLAGMVADGSQMTPKQLHEWVEGAENLRMIAEYTVPWVTVENPHARDLAMQWIKSKKEHVASSGWSTYSGLVATKPDDALDLTEIESLLGAVVKGIKSAKNRVRYTMNVFVIAVGGVRQALSETSQSHGSSNRRRFRGSGRYRVQRAACHCVHRKNRGSRPGRPETKNNPMLGRGTH
jgi:3-methyladenine DNA glycosylase AlkD